MKEKIETRHTEIRVKTTDPQRLINMFTSKRILKTWVEDFMDEDTGEVVEIERNEVIFDRGILIDQDNLTELQFHIQSGDVTDVEVSNQRRLAYAGERKYLRPYIAIVECNDKKHKLLFWSQGIEQAIELLKDYVELNYTGIFFILSIKEFSASIILLDTFKKLSPEFEGERAIEELDEDNKKFYQIEFNVEDTSDAVSIGTYTAIVHTYNVDRAMMLINDWLTKNEQRRYDEAVVKGNTYEMRELTTTIELAKPIPVGEYIPREFSEAYN